MEDIKNWIDITCTAIIASVVSVFTWLNIELPHITMWLSFVSMLLSVAWWVHRWIRHYKAAHHE